MPNTKKNKSNKHLNKKTKTQKCKLSKLELQIYNEN